MDTLPVRGGQLFLRVCVDGRIGSGRDGQRTEGDAKWPATVGQ